MPSPTVSQLDLMDNVKTHDTDFLESEIIRNEALRSQLEKEVNSLTQSISQGPSGAFSTLPIELLVEIFESAIYGNPKQLHRLLLVCQTWNEIIRATPQLWCNLRITIPLESSKLDRCTEYCTMFVKHSGERPLDIGIDYLALEASKQAFDDIMEKRVRQVSDSSHFVRELKWFMRRRSGGRDNLYHYYDMRYLKPLRVLSGKDGSVMSRWRSFEMASGSLFHTLSLPEAAFSSNIFQGKSPLLERLKMDYSSTWVFEGDERSYITTWNQPVQSKLPCFPSSPSLQELLLTNISPPISVQDINPQNIQRLRMHFYDMDQFQFALRCQNITTMHIGFSTRTEESMRRSSPPESLLFPHLTRLELGSRLPTWFFRLITAPLLTTISFVTDDAFRGISGMVLPSSVTRVECRWPWYYYYESTFNAGLSAVVQSPSVTTILCTRRYQTQVQKVLKRLSTAGSRSDALSTLLIVLSYQDPESKIVEIVDVASVLAL